jgi:hypothetical protein
MILTVMLGVLFINYAIVGSIGARLGSRCTLISRSPDTTRSRKENDAITFTGLD